MTELSVIENIEAEQTDLKLHTELCAQRYNQLIAKFDEVDQRLDGLTQLCSEIKSSITSINTSTQATYLKWAGFVIVLLTGVIGGLIGKLV
jgi:hypothetical protein